MSKTDEKWIEQTTKGFKIKRVSSDTKRPISYCECLRKNSIIWNSLTIPRTDIYFKQQHFIGLPRKSCGNRRTIRIGAFLHWGQPRDHHRTCCTKSRVGCIFGPTGSVTPSKVCLKEEDCCNTVKGWPWEVGTPVYPYGRTAAESEQVQFRVGHLLLLMAVAGLWIFLHGIALHTTDDTYLMLAISATCLVNAVGLVLLGSTVFKTVGICTVTESCWY